MFDPEPFDVPEASDARVAAISAYVDDIAFHDAASLDGDIDSRWITAVDEHQAVRLDGISGELYPDDADVVRYVIDLSLGIDEGPGTLFIDTVELPGMDYERNVSVLDEMVRTIELDTNDEYADQTIVARYEGGSSIFSGSGTVEGDDLCIAVPLDGETRSECFNAPPAYGLRFDDLSGDLFPALAGVTGLDTFRVEIDGPDSTFTYLPVRIEGSDFRGFVAPIAAEDATRISWFDLDGEELGLRLLDTESDHEPLGEFEETPLQTDGFPAEGDTSFLKDVRVYARPGFDRVVFEFTSGDLSWEIDQRDELLAISGDPVDLEGQTVLAVTMTPAAGVDLSGTEPVQTYEGPVRIEPTTTVMVEELAEAQDFEAVLVWGIGLDSDARIAVAELDDPHRLVIDIEH